MRLHDRVAVAHVAPQRSPSERNWPPPLHNRGLPTDGSRALELLRCPYRSLPDRGLQRRGAAFERAWRPLWEEASVDASEHTLGHELVPTVLETDLRKSKVFFFFVQGLPIGRGLPMVGDMCMCSAMHRGRLAVPGRRDT